MNEPVSDLTMTLLLIVIGALVLILYFLPAIIASERIHPNSRAILALNLLLGWTFIGWVIALVWSLTAINRRPD